MLPPSTCRILVAGVILVAAWLPSSAGAQQGGVPTLRAARAAEPLDVEGRLDEPFYAATAPGRSTCGASRCGARSSVRMSGCISRRFPSLSSSLSSRIARASRCSRR